MKKKFLGMFLLFSIALVGCSSLSGSDDQTETQMEPQEDAEIQTGQSSSVLDEPENILVAYFSWADNAVLDDDVDAVSSPSVIPPGNVQQLAGEIAGESEEGTELQRISVQFGENTVVYELNDSPAAASLCEQLPITVEVEDYSTNEKIFYPEQGLDTTDTPTAEGGAGTLAYYSPWGDVVMFYNDYDANPSLFELGQAVSGTELIGEMTGTIVIDLADTGDE